MSTNKLAEAVMLLIGVCGISGLKFQVESDSPD
jgi:hypothetical protein